MSTAPCRWARHAWTRWLPLEVLHTFDGRPAGVTTTQYRICRRCRREQRVPWWRR